MKTIHLLIAMLLTLTAFSQQNAQYNHYIFNQLVINPAYAGTKDLININGIYASQWTRIDGSPTTQTLSVEGPSLYNLGLGLHMIQDKIGAQTQTAMYGNYAYKIQIKDSIYVSLGIATGVSYNSLNGQLLDEGPLDDPAIPEVMETITRFDSKAGIFLYSRKFYAGFSVSDLTSNLRSSIDQLIAGQIRHYYLTSGYVFDINNSLKLKTGFLIKEDFRAPTNVDLNVFFLYKNLIWAGATYRTGAEIFNTKSLDTTLRLRDAVVFMMDVNLNNSFRIGYAYTHTLSALKDYPGHEISLGYYFKTKNKTKMLTPRYF